MLAIEDLVGLHRTIQSSFFSIIGQGTDLDYRYIERFALETNRDHSVIFEIPFKYCIGTWNVRSMNQGKLEVVKQEMARVNIDIVGISELKWTGMGEFNSHDHYIYYCGQESLRRNGVAIMVNKRV